MHGAPLLRPTRTEQTGSPPSQRCGNRRKPCQSRSNGWFEHRASRAEYLAAEQHQDGRTAKRGRASWQVITSRRTRPRPFRAVRGARLHRKLPPYSCTPKRTLRGTNLRPAANHAQTERRLLRRMSGSSGIVWDRLDTLVWTPSSGHPCA